MLKRFLVLACVLVLFVTAFFIHQWWTDAELEGDFRVERQKFHVDGQDLVTANPPASEPLTPTPPPLPVSPSADGTIEPSTPAPEVTPAPAGTSAPSEVPLDSNTLIGPVPPPSTPSATPDTNAPANPVPPSTNSSPDSTLVYPGLRGLSAALLTAYHLPSPSVQETSAAPATPAVPAPATTTNAGQPAATNAPAAIPAHAEPVSESKAGNPAASVIILGYHQFTPPGVRAGGKMIYTMPQDVFDYEMKYLKDNHYNVVPLSDVVAFAKHQISLPPNTVAVTIDDGYKSAIVYAAPVLKKYGFPWTFFVYPSFITRNESKGAASWPDLVELQKEGVDIECHSMTHPLLTKVGHKSPAEYDAWLTTETVNPKAIIEKELGKNVKYFAYPYGAYNKQVEAKAIAAGYEAIFTVANNPIHPGTNPYAMGRYIITTPVEKLYVSYLREGALGLANINPPPGSTVTDPRPVISAELGYAGHINPASIVAEVSNMGEVKYDFDPKASTLRLYLPRDLIESAIKVNVYAKDADTGKTMVASWRFNYQMANPGAAHPPIGAAPGTNAAPVPMLEPVRSTRIEPAAGGSNSVTTAAPSNAAPAEAQASPATPPAGATAPSNAAPATNAAP
jgi:peptidoglycan/xylan/chitin deacetylase (PgdA/CDA1 family)